MMRKRPCHRRARLLFSLAKKSCSTSDGKQELPQQQTVAGFLKSANALAEKEAPSQPFKVPKVDAQSEGFGVGHVYSADENTGLTCFKTGNEGSATGDVSDADNCTIANEAYYLDHCFSTISAVSTFGAAGGRYTASTLILCTKRKCTKHSKDCDSSKNHVSSKKCLIYDEFNPTERNDNTTARKNYPRSFMLNEIPVILLRILATSPNQEFPIHSRFCHQGKATIQLKEPSIHICIDRACPNTLQDFLVTLNKVHQAPYLVNLPHMDSISRQIAKSEKSHHHTQRLSILEHHNIPSSFPPHIKSLKICRHGLHQVPTAVSRLLLLTALDLSGNSFKVLPRELRQLSQLQSLAISNNGLERIQLGLLPGGLRRLDVSFNRLTHLPTHIDHLSNLEYLIASHNFISEIPARLSNIKSLRIVRLGSNTISHLPYEFRSFADHPLQELNLSENPIREYSQVDRVTPPEAPWLSLQELSARVFLRHGFHYNHPFVPQTLQLYLSRASRCSRCSGPYITGGVFGVLPLRLEEVAEKRVLPACGTVVRADLSLCGQQCWMRMFAG